MPRIGFAYSLAPKTVIRGGYGIYCEPLGVTNIQVNQSGFNQSTAFVGTVDNGQNYVAGLTNPFPSGFLQPLGAGGGSATFLGQNISFFNPSLTNPYMQRWQFAVQQQLPGKSLLEVSYVGNRGTRLRATQDLNRIPQQYYSTSPARDQAAINLLNSAVPNPFYPLLPGTNLAGTTVAALAIAAPVPAIHGYFGRDELRFLVVPRAKGPCGKALVERLVAAVLLDMVEVYAGDCVSQPVRLTAGESDLRS